MESGLYAVNFGTPDGSAGNGVAVFTESRALGGDDSYYYDGTVTTSGGTIEADVLVRKYRDTGTSVFGDLREFRLRLRGNASGPRFVLTGQVVEQPGLTIIVQCTKLAAS